MNKPIVLELLFDTPVVGKSQFGNYYLYAVKNGTNEEYSFFAPEEVHTELSKFKKGDKVSITKIAEQNGKKVVTNYEVKPLSNGKPAELNNNVPPAPSKDNYYDIMLASCKDAVEIQKEIGGMFDPKSIAVTLFIARTKINGSNGY